MWPTACIEEITICLGYILRKRLEIFVNDIKINQYIGYSGQMMQVLIITN